MSPRNKIAARNRPQTPSGLGLGSSNTPTKRSVSSSSSTSLKGVAPCFHTTRPQFISSHIERCEACRQKYARQAEQTTIPYVPSAVRRASGVQQQPQTQRPQSRQSLGTNRPSSSASVRTVGASAMGATTGQSHGSGMRPSSRASVASAASRLQNTERSSRSAHHRSSSAGAPLLEARANTRRAIARAAEYAATGDGSQTSGSLPSPPPRGDANFMGGSSSDNLSSPTETVASRTRSRASRGAKAGGQPRNGRRDSSHSLHQTRKTGMPDFDAEIAQPVDLTSALMGTLVDRTRDHDKIIEKKDSEIMQLKAENQRLRQQQQQQATTQPSADSAESANIFNPNSAAARQRAQERAQALDSEALEKFSAFRHAYEECEPSLRTNRAQFAGERPLSPPPARPWGSSGTPMRKALDSDADARLATLNAAEVRRAGEDLLSTPVRRTTRTLRGTSTRRTRVARPLFADESELSDDGESSDDEDDERRVLRNCLMAASNFGTFLVQYVTRQCMDFTALSDSYRELQEKLDAGERKLAVSEKRLRHLEEIREGHVTKQYEMSTELAKLTDELDRATRANKISTTKVERLEQELAKAHTQIEAQKDEIARKDQKHSQAQQLSSQQMAKLRHRHAEAQADLKKVTKEREDLRTELRGRLQRSGQRGDVDEYLARVANASASSGLHADGSNAAAMAASNPAAADTDVKRLEDSAKFMRKKAEGLKRKLFAEEKAKKLAVRKARMLEDAIERYCQAFGPLPDDAEADMAEPLSAIIPGFSDVERRNSTQSVVSPIASDASLSDGNSVIEGSGEEAAALDSLPEQSDSDDGAAAAAAAAEADEQDIRRHELRMRNRSARRAATPRLRRGAANSGGRNRRSPRPSALSVDVSTGSGIGESLGDILGAGSQWAESPQSRSRTSTMRGLPSQSLADELGALDSGAGAPVPPSPQLPRSRRRSFRGGPIPFGDSGSPGFGIGFDASVSLAEQFAAASRRSSAGIVRLQTVDVGVCTDPLPEPNVRSVEVAPEVSAAAHTEQGMQTGSATGELGVQATCATNVQASATDVDMSTLQQAVDAIPQTATAQILVAGPDTTQASVVTDVCADSSCDVSIDVAVSACIAAVEAVPQMTCTSNMTDPDAGKVSTGIWAGAQVCSTALQAEPAQKQQAIATDSMEGMSHRSVSAVASARDMGVSAGSHLLHDAATATANVQLVERGSDAVRQLTVDAATSAQTVPTADAQLTTDDWLLTNWLAPLIPDGITSAMVLAALAREGQSVSEILAERAATEAALREQAEQLQRQAEMEAADAEAAAQSAKVLVDRGTESEIVKIQQREFEVQVEPQMVSKMQQAGWTVTADAAIDAAIGPELASVAVATVSRPMDRWVEPFDPVARADRSVDVVVTTSTRATSHDIEYASVAVGPICQVCDAAADSVTAVAQAATCMDIAVVERAAGGDVEVAEQGVQAGVLETTAASTSTTSLLVDREAEPAFAIVDAITEPTFEVSNAATESCLAVVDTATGPDNAAVDMATEPILATADCASEANLVPAHQNAGTSTAILTANAAAIAAPVPADAAAATSDTLPLSRGISTSSSTVVNDVAVQTSAGFTESAYTTIRAPTAEAGTFMRESSPFVRNEGAATSVDSLGSAMGVSPIVTGGSYQSALQHRSRPPVPAIPGLGKSFSARSPSPRIPLPPLPPQSQSMPGSASMSVRLGGSAIDLNRSLGEHTQSHVPLPAEGESDHEDYGYIMVSPRTNVQRVPVSTLSSRVSSNASKPSSPKTSMLGLQRVPTPGESSEHSRGLGCDDYDEDEKADDAAEHPSMSPLSFGATRAIALQTEELVPKRSSVSIGVEANMPHQIPQARQPEPLIVQSIARTMVGTPLYKYTNTRFSHSNGRERRHERYFWVNPYAKLLNWSKQPPSTGVGMARNHRESGGRCVGIRQVRIVEEPRRSSDGPDEPAYCIVVRTDYREIKLKAKTQTEHDLWFMALSYMQTRRIITSETYPTMPLSTTVDAAAYQSNESLHTRNTSVGSVDSNQRIIMRADRRQRTEQSRSRSRSRIAIGSLLEGRPPLPPSQPPTLPRARQHSSSVNSVATTYESFARSEGVDALPESTASYGSNSGDQHSAVSGGSRRASRVLGGSASAHPHRSTIDVTPTRVHSLQSTPRSLRPVSMVPGSDSAKRLSLGLFRRMGNSSATSLFRHVSPSDDSAGSPRIHQPVSADDALQQQQSIAAAMISNGESAASPSNHRASVRKMFSGSFLRALRSRESVVDED
ncbi:hypothetical protein IWW36_000349 [Coemansia brasiliensis]|uniref:PH domain-containing protein n=1 Tax=Coemansia brasiliensis TaxID=2650707 RepID=A0A9W8IHQ7_9FUNG|nr:hypothetical protein IWW36_000349 [Coemansia brasiliensis]